MQIPPQKKEGFDPENTCIISLHYIHKLYSASTNIFAAVGISQLKHIWELSKEQIFY